MSDYWQLFPTIHVNVQYCINIKKIIPSNLCIRISAFFVFRLYYKKTIINISFVVTSPASRISFCTALISFSTWRTLFLTSTSSLANWLCFSFSCSLCLSSGFRSAECAVCSWINCCLAWQRKRQSLRKSNLTGQVGLNRTKLSLKSLTHSEAYELWHLWHFYGKVIPLMSGADVLNIRQQQTQFIKNNDWLISM